MKFLFELYKDKQLTNSSTFKEEVIKKYNLTIEEANRLYREITNYQIKKYGQVLNNFCQINSLNSKTIMNAKERRHNKRRNMIEGRI